MVLWPRHGLETDAQNGVSRLVGDWGIGQMLSHGLEAGFLVARSRVLTDVRHGPHGRSVAGVE